MAPVKWLAVYRNGELDETFTDSSPDMKLIRYLRKHQRVKKYFTSANPLRVILFDDEDPWAEVREQLSRDFTFRTVLADVVNGMALARNVDGLCFRTITWGVKEHPPELSALAELVGEIAASAGWVSYIKETFQNYVRWVVFTGVVPVAYINKEDVGKTLPELGAPLSARRVAQYVEMEGRVFSRIPPGADPAELVGDVLRKKYPHHVSQIKRLLGRLKGLLAPDEYRETSVACLRLLKQHVGAPVVFVPPMRAGVSVALCVNDERAYVRDWLDNCYACDLIHPPDFTPRGGLRGPVSVGSAQWEAFRGLFEHFTSALVVNTKRTVVVSEREQKSDLEASRADFVDLIAQDAQNFPKNLLELIMTQKVAEENRRSLADTISGTNVHHDLSLESSALALSGLHNRSETLQQKKLYDEFKSHLARVNGSSEEFALVKKIADGILRGATTDLTGWRTAVSNESFRLLELLLRAHLETTPKEGVDVVSVGKNNHIIHSFGAVPGLADMEELMVLYYTLWESIIGGSFGFTRRRNAISYNGTKPPEAKLDVVTQEGFLRLINSAGRVLDALFGAPPTMTLTDALLLMDKVDAKTIRGPLAALIGVKTSQMLVRELLPEERPSGIATKVPALQTKLYPNKTPKAQKKEQ